MYIFMHIFSTFICIWIADLYENCKRVWDLLLGCTLTVNNWFNTVWLYVVWFECWNDLKWNCITRFDIFTKDIDIKCLQIRLCQHLVKELLEKLSIAVTLRGLWFVELLHLQLCFFTQTDFHVQLEFTDLWIDVKNSLLFTTFICAI